MPYVKSISVHSTPAKSIAYIVNPDKTEDLLYVSGLNCSTVPTIAYVEIKNVFENYSAHSFDEKKAINSKTPVKLFHFVQSFSPQENISPELAHKIAQEWATKAFGKERQIIVSTHLDKGHIHSHIIINPYDFNGKKFNSNIKTLEAIRNLSDTISLKYDIKPIPKKKTKKSVSYKEWDERKKGSSWKQDIRNKIDKLIYNVKSLEELLCSLEADGYIVRRSNNKCTSIRPPDISRAVRLRTLGDGYDEDSINQRIEIAQTQLRVDEESPETDEAKIANMSYMEKLYTKRIYEVSNLVRNGEKVAKKYNTKLPYSVENDFEVYHLARQLQIIKRDNIHSIDNLEQQIKKVEEAHNNCREELNILSKKQDQFKTIIDNAEQYFKLKDIPTYQLTQAERLKLKMASDITERCNITTIDELNSVKRLYEDNQKKADVLNASFDKLERRFREYNDIEYRYKHVSQKDYISRLIDEKKRTSKIE